MKCKHKTQGIEIIIGPMFSGKTTELLRRYEQAAWARQRPQLFKPSLDTRYAADKVVAHNGLWASCVVVARPNDIPAWVASDTAVVAIDEAQFFDDAAELGEVARMLARSGKRIIIAGLDTDKWRMPFAWVSRFDDQVKRTRLSARCAVCGRPARFTACLIDERQLPPRRIDVGGMEKYEPRCERCFEEVLQQPSDSRPSTSDPQPLEGLGEDYSAGVVDLLIVL